MDTKPKITFLSKLAIVIAALGLVCLIIFILIVSKHYTIARIDGKGPIDMSATGQVGDFIGGLVGTLWALSTVMLLYESLRIQGESLHSQHQSLIKQGKEIVTQNERWERQRTEDFYFRLIESHSRITSSDPEENEYIKNVVLSLNRNIQKESSFEKASALAEQDIFKEYQSDILHRTAESLFLMAKFLLEFDKDGSLISHLSATIPLYEKRLLFYYLLAYYYRFNVLPESIKIRYVKSELVQKADVPDEIKKYFTPGLYPS